LRIGGNLVTYRWESRYIGGYISLISGRLEVSAPLEAARA